MADGFNETPVRGKRRSNTAPVGEDALAALPAVATAGTPSYVEGNVVGLSTDLAGRVRVVIGDTTEPNALDVDVTDRQARILGMVRTDADTRTFETTLQNQVRDALLAGLESVSLNADTRDDLVTRLTASINAQTTTLSTNLEDTGLNQATRDDLVNRLSTNLESVDLNAATLAALERTTPQVRGADVDDNNPLPVNVQTNPGTLIDSGLLTFVNLAPGAVTTLDSAVVGASVTGRLVEITAASSVRIRVELQTFNGTAATGRRVFFLDPTGSSLVYQPVDRDVITAPAGSRFRLSITNLDNLRTADVYGSTTHVEFA